MGACRKNKQEYHAPAHPTRHSAYYTPTDADGIPTGEILSVEGTPLDFQESHRIGERIDQMTLPAVRGYDNNFVLFGNNGTEAKAQNVDGHVSEECVGKIDRLLVGS